MLEDRWCDGEVAVLGLEVRRTPTCRQLKTSHTTGPRSTGTFYTYITLKMKQFQLLSRVKG